MSFWWGKWKHKFNN